MIGLWVLVAGLVLGIAVGLITSWAARVLLPVGLLLPLIAVVAAYLIAPESSRGSECSDCGQYLGRWWAPWVPAFLGGMALVAWIVGALIARAVTARRSQTV